jgi:hypothetical protein
VTIRVLQWSSGRVGTACARAMLSRPQEFDLAGLGVYDPAKIGRDIGEVLGQAPIGRAAVSVRDLAAIDADCVVHTPKGESDPDTAVADICEVLSSGKNVCSTTLGSLVHPRTMAAEHRAKIVAACREGSSTFHATGINPGFFSDIMTVVLSGLCRDVDRVYALEVYDYSRHTSRATIVDLLKFGRPPEIAHVPRKSRVTPADPGIHMLADGMGVSIDEVKHEHQWATADAAFDVTATRIEAGMHVGYRSIHRAFERGQERICFEFIGRAAPHVAPHWPAPAREGLHRWENRLYGDPNIVSSIEMGMEDPDGRSGSTATGLRAVNAVAAVCAAPPGIVTTLDLPMLRAPMRSLA